MKLSDEPIINQYQMNLKFVHLRRLHISTSYIMVPGKSNYRSGTKAALFVDGHIFLLYSPTIFDTCK